jgi:hypothetical protein
VLERATRSDDAEGIISAIRLIKGVLSVEGNVADMNQYIAIAQARNEIGEKILDIIYPDRRQQALRRS